DNMKKYHVFIRTMKIKNLIIKKFPDVFFNFGDTRLVNESYRYINLNNSKCLIHEDTHDDKESNTMYVEMIGNKIMIKCKHLDCFGKIYQNVSRELTQCEMEIIFSNESENETISRTTDDDDND